MVITICGSMHFHREMVEARNRLIALGHDILLPKDLEVAREGEYEPIEDIEEHISAKIEHDFIREHFRKIEKSDAILVLNYEKKGIPHYVGGNTFLEMGYAYGHDKKIYLLHSVPDMDYCVEMHAMQPVILDGDLTKI